MHLNQKRNTIFYGWWIVGACFLISAYTGGVIHFGFTAFFEPIANEFDWSYAQISFAASLRGMEMGLLAPVVGLLVDRWGPRRLMFGGTILTGLGLILLSRINSLGMFYGAFVLIAIGTSTCMTTVMVTAVVHWFRRKAGIATGITVSGFALGGLLVPLVATLISMFEWRTALVIIGMGMWGIATPLSLLVRHKPEHYGYLPDGDVSGTAVIDESLVPVQSAEVNIGAKQALKSRAFWHIALAFMYHSLAVSAIMTHVMPYLSSIGIVRSVSSLVAGAIPVTSIGGRIGFGWLGDRYDKRWLTAAGFAILGLGLLFFSYVTIGGMWLIVPSIILLGTGWGSSIPMRVSLLREYFGRSRFGTIIGFNTGIMMLGGMAGAPIAGWVFDKWGSYQGAWLVLAGLAIAAVVIIATTPPVRTTTWPVDKPRA